MRSPVRLQPAGVSAFAKQRAQGRSLPVAFIHQSGPALAKEHFDDRRLNSIQKKVNDAIIVAKSNPFANGNMVEGVVFTANTPVIVQHDLGIPFRNALVMLPTGFARFKIVPNSTSALDARQVQIESDANCTADVWVYG